MTRILMPPPINNLKINTLDLRYKLRIIRAAKKRLKNYSQSLTESNLLPVAARSENDLSESSSLILASRVLLLPERLDDSTRRWLVSSDRWTKTDPPLLDFLLGIRRLFWRLKFFNSISYTSSTISNWFVHTSKSINKPLKYNSITIRICKELCIY